MRSSAGSLRIGRPLKNGGSGSTGDGLLGVKLTDAVLDACSINVSVEELQTKSGSHCSQRALLGLLLRFQVVESASHDFLRPQPNPHGYEKNIISASL